MNEFNVSDIKNSDPILDELKGAVDSKKKQFNSAISSERPRLKTQTYNSNLDALTDQRFEPLVYLNLVINHKSLFDKKPTKLKSFNDQRLMNLLTILADDEFWSTVYTPLAEQYNTYIEGIKRRNSNLSFESSFSAMANVSNNKLSDGSAEKSIIVRVLYFLMCGNPYSTYTLGSDLKKEELVKGLYEIVQKLRFEIQLLENRLVEINFFITTVEQSGTFELDLTYTHYHQFIIDELTKCFNVFSPLSKVWGGEELLHADDLIELWGGSKKSFMNERAKKESFISRVDYGSFFGFSWDDSIEWLKNKKALGAIPFNVMNHAKDIQVSDLDESPPKVYPEVAKIKVVGVGGAGGNMIAHMINHNIEGIDFIYANTDSEALSKADNGITLELGNSLTKGLGAGANPDIGRKAAESDRSDIKLLLSDADIVFIVAGMGGGTGTGAAPVIASIAKDLGVLTIGVVTKPFEFEGKKRMSVAEKGLVALDAEVDTLIIHDNYKLMDEFGEEPFSDAFFIANEKSRWSVQGISDLLMKKSLVAHVDLADLELIFSNSGNTRFLQGKDKTAHLATSHAIKNEFLEDMNLKNSKSILINITSAEPKVAMLGEVWDIIEKNAHKGAAVICNIVEDKSLEDDILVTIFLNMGKNNYQKNLLKKIGRRYVDADSIDFLDVPTFMRKQLD